jgi:hypothetical protein
MMIAALLLSLLPAPAEDWRPALASGDATAYVDMDSIVERDGKRHFRIRLVQTGSPRSVVSTNVMDCAAKSMDAIRMEGWVDGKFEKGEDYPAGKYHYDLTEDPDSAKLIELVCGPIG